MAQVTRNRAAKALLARLATNLLVDRDGDTASVRANVVVVFAREESRPERVSGAVFRSGVHRGAWLFRQPL